MGKCFLGKQLLVWHCVIQLSFIIYNFKRSQEDHVPPIFHLTYLNHVNEKESHNF